jgi:hypothetical protein
MRWKTTDRKDRTATIETVDDGGLIEAYIKWDGCCEIYKKFFGPAESYDQIHICDIPSFIKRLEEIEKIRLEMFGE